MPTARGLKQMAAAAAAGDGPKKAPREEEQGGEPLAKSRCRLPTTGGHFYRVIYKPRIAVCAEPNVKAQIVFAFPKGTIFHAGDALECGWVPLAEDELWVHQLKAGFVLIDGAEVGCGLLMEPIPDSEVTEDTWPYAYAVRKAAQLGVPFQARPEHMRPADSGRLRQSWLSAWHEPGCLEPVRWSPAAPLQAAAAGPRLCVALLLRGLAVGPVESFLRYHHSIGFERVALFFDAPDDPAERPAIEAAIAYSLDAREGREVQVHLCSKDWWEEEKQLSRFYRRKEQNDPVYRDMVDLHERVHDVQARQCLAIERAIRDAQEDGYDWLLHIDADEALLLPRERDARAFFGAVPAEFDQVVFNNLEAVPENLEVRDWFREVSLFKVHHTLLREANDEIPDVDTSAEGERRAERRERWMKRKLASGTDPDSLKKNRTFDRLMVGVRMARRAAALDFDFDLPAPDPDSEASDSEPGEGGGCTAASRARLRNALPSYYTAYANGKAACRIRRGGPPPLPIGVHRCTSDGNAALRNYRCNGPGEPVVLHYANCGFSAWRRKYEILSTGHGTEDGGFSVTRKGINSMRAHLAHRDLLRRGSPEQLEVYYKTFIMCNEFGELPHFACHGLVARTRAVAELICAEAGA